MVSLRGDDPISIDVRGTALDVLANTEHLVVAGSNSLRVLTVGSTSANTCIRIRSNRSLVRLLKFNPLLTGNFASVSGQFIDVYSLDQASHIHRLASFTAQSRKVSDFCWCPFDDQLMISCADSDSVNFWDLRTALNKPTAQLGVTLGAGQSKFAPHLNNYLLTTHGTDVRLWDLRHTSQPIVQFVAHQSKVLCLDWHPHHQEANSFFTSANDSTLKLWNMVDQRSAPSIASMAPFSAWRLVFSHEGEELAALGLPPANALALFSNYGLENPRLLKGIERDILMDAAWHKSTTAQKSTTKFLYTLSAVKHRLCRHAIAYELSNELRDEMAMPITQSKTDEERDRLVAAGEQDPAIDPELMQMASGSLDDPEVRIDQPTMAPTTSEARSSINSHSILVGSIKNASLLMGGGATPQSPICSEWQRWVRAPNVAGGDLLTELEALRKHTTEGLYTTEVNYTRMAIGFSYMHLNKFRKINFEMRFHLKFIDNGLVFVEVLQKDSPFTPDKASLFLTLLQQESDEQFKMPSDQTILCRCLQQLPRIIDLMKVFTPSIDVPSLSKASSQSGSASDEQFLAALATAADPTTGIVDLAAMPSAATRSISAAVPCSYTPSPFDHRVPAPRNCGARFNQSGYLVAFGPNNSIFSAKESRDIYDERIPRIVPPMKGRKAIGSGRLGSRSQPSESKVPRSLAEYCVFVNPISGASLRQTSSTLATPFFQSSPPIRCISPDNIAGDIANRPTSSFPRHTESMAIGPVDAATSGQIGRYHQSHQQKNSLSPPSLLRQNPSSEQAEQQQRGSQARSIIGARVLGSSPNSSASSTVRSFSLQNLEGKNSIRHRGISMSGAVATNTGASTTAAAAASIAELSASAATNILFSQHQSMPTEHAGSTSGPAAVMPEQSFNSIVVVYDATTLLPISQSLARSYKLLGASPIDICRHNFEMAAKQGRKDLMGVWKLVEQCAHTPYGQPTTVWDDGSAGRMTQFARLFRLDENKIPRVLEAYTSLNVPWDRHPLGRELVNRLIDHFASKFDIQTAAIITCIILPRANGNAAAAGAMVPKRPFSIEIVGMAHSIMESPMDAARIPLPPLHIPPPSRKTSYTLPNVPSANTSTTSNWTRSFAVDHFGCSRVKQSMDHRLSPAPDHLSSSSPSPNTTTIYPLPQKEANSEILLDPALSSNRFQEIRRKYADILYRWRMYKKCAEVLKHCKSEGEEAIVGIIKTTSWCSFCGQQQQQGGCARCAGCRRPPIYCAICEQPCKGVIATCTSCSHGGHFLHIANWFDAQSQCPLGCGCECKF